MNLKTNRRLKEIKLSVYLNHIDKLESRKRYNDIMSILSCVALSISGNANKVLHDLTQISICDGYARATDKELVATCKAFFSQAKMAKRMGIVPNTFINRYKDLLSRDFITEEWLSTLVPLFNSTDEQVIVDVLINFIEKFVVPSTRLSHELMVYKRTYELEFYVIYSKLIEIFRNSTLVDKFLFNIARVHELDYPTLANLKNNTHLICRDVPHTRYNHRYFMQELTTLYKAKGLSKHGISKKVFSLSSSYAYTTRGSLALTEINMKEDSWQYCATINWDNMDELSVRKFIGIMYDFINYDV